MTIEVRVDKKSLLIALLLLLSVGMGVAWCYDHLQLNKELSEQIENSAGKDIIIKRWKDKAGAEHVVSEMRQVSLRELKQSQDSAIIKLREEIGKIKNLVQQVKITATTAGTFIAVGKDTTIQKSVTDTAKVAAKVYNYKDSWLSFKATITGDSMRSSYSVANKFTHLEKWARPKWYKAKELTMEITSENPNTSVNKVQTIVVSQPKGKWFQSRIVIGVAAFGTGYLVGRLH